jgi:hypothetical protein
MLSSLDVAWFKYLSINKERDRVASSPMIAEMAASIGPNFSCNCKMV